VPHVVGLEKDERGYVRRLELNWMRKAVKPMSQLEFAIQSADLLMQLHEKARIIHLDLRLDNFVITDDGVGFVDYGSSARVGENIGASPFLNNLFTEIMRTSQIQRMLEKMATAGAVTSELITGSRQKVDKAVDLFYLAVQIEKPNVNPYIRELVHYDPSSVEAKLISHLCQRVLRPDDPKDTKFHSARDVLDGLLDISRKLGRE
jgi:serine/threonine protein kinase